jgi:hypothetical protein
MQDRDIRRAAAGPPGRRLVVAYAHPGAFVPLARVILSNLGYAILSDEEWRAHPTLSTQRPELQIVEERRLAEVPADEARPVPIVLLTGRQGARGADPRVVGAVRTPAGLHELYRLMQQALEPTPRTAPRLPTHIPARCKSGRREWSATLLSLSENGCLLRSHEPLALGAEVEIAFELPQAGRIETAAESAYQILPDTGLVFQRTPAASREAIARFVEQHLLAGP